MVQMDHPATGGRDTIAFASFRLALRAGQLTRDGAPIPLRPKTWGVLVYLAERPGVLISKDELLDAVWPDVAVTPDTLTKSIGELRRALGDDSKAPRYIETAHRRGFRFIAEVQVPGPQSPVSGYREVQPKTTNPKPGTGNWGLEDPPGTGDRGQGNPVFVGRESELRRLEELLNRAHRGERQLVFVTGPPGVGKTTLIEAFLDAPVIRHTAVTTWIGRGASIEQHGTREAYMPVLEALERLAHHCDVKKLTPLLQHTAPSWLVQIPWLLGGDASAALQAQHVAKPDRMLREFTALTEALSADATLVLVLEDLHWSDPSTVDLLAMLAQRQEPARLLVIATYRPADLVVQEHPLAPAVHMLKARHRCVELPIHELTAADVQRYLDSRFPGAEFPPALAALVHGHTDGNPLFMVAVVDHMLSRGVILNTAPGWALSTSLERIELGVPDQIGQMVEAQIATLSPSDRELIEVASIGGVELAVPAIANVLGADPSAIETRCENLARARRFLRPAGNTEWPDGSVTRRYLFFHELYRQVVYGAIPDRQRARLHHRFGEVLEVEYGERQEEIAPAVAVHFEKSRDRVRAIPYLIIAGARARRRFANREALAYFDAALTSLAQLPEDNVHRRLELGARTILGPVLADLHGYASGLVRENYERADALGAKVGTPAEQFEIVYALCHYHTNHGNFEADAISARLDTLADRVGTDVARLRADSALVRIALVAGRYGESERRMQRLFGINAVEYSNQQPGFGPDALIDAQTHYALALWFLGDPERARTVSRGAIEAARASGLFFTQAAALTLGGILEVFCGNAGEALALAEEALRVCHQGGFALWEAMATAVQAQAVIINGETQRGLAELDRARTALRATGAAAFSTHILAFLAGAQRHDGNLKEALAAVEEALALAESTLDRSYWPELWRLKGEILLAGATPLGNARSGKRVPATQADRSQAERCLLHALNLARKCNARSLELRAATSLARAWHARGRSADARIKLAKVCRRFPAECSSPDLREARTLLDSLSGSDRLPVKTRQPSHLARGRRISANLPKTFRT